MSLWMKTVTILKTSSWKRAIVIILLILVAGCGSLEVAPVPSKAMSEFNSRISSDGFEIGIDAWTDPDKIKNHFGMNLLSRGIVPFEVAFANVGAEGGFFLQPELVVILDESGLQRVDSGSCVIAGYYADPVISMISPVYTILVQGANDDAWAVNRHMESVRFMDRPLYRTDSNRGFIFLGFEGMGKLSQAAAAKFQVKNIRTKQEKTIIVPLKGR